MGNNLLAEAEETLKDVERNLHEENYVLTIYVLHHLTKLVGNLAKQKSKNCLHENIDSSLCMQCGKCIQKLPCRRMEKTDQLEIFERVA